MKYESEFVGSDLVDGGSSYYYVKDYRKSVEEIKADMIKFAKEENRKFAEREVTFLTSYVLKLYKSCSS